MSRNALALSILKAADRVARGDADRVNMDDVARKAGISRATLYRHFPNRAALLAAIQLEDDGTTRERLLRAVDDVITREGLGGLTVDAIAAAAQTSPATIYKVFGDRKALLRAYAETKSPRSAARALALDQATPIEAALVDFAAKALQMLAQSRPIMLAVVSAPQRARDELGDVHDPARGTVASLTKFFEARRKSGELGVEGASPAHLAQMFAGLLLTQAVLLPPSASKPDAATLVRTFLRGAAAGAPAGSRRGGARA